MSAETLSDVDIAELHIAKTARYGEILASGDLELRPGVVDLIASAREKGLRVAVATTTNRANVEALTQACWGLAAEDVFELNAAGDEVPAKKPAPDDFALALQRLAISPDQALAFEDSRNGLLSAVSSGLWVIVTPSIYTDNQDFSEAWMVVDSLVGFNHFELMDTALAS